MLSSLQQRIDKTKRFVKEHKTLVACSLTAVGTYLVVRDVTVMNTTDVIRAVNSIKLNIENRLDHLTLSEHLNHLDFINHKELQEEFLEFSKQMENFRASRDIHGL